MTPELSRGMAKYCLPYFFETLDIGMLYGSVHVDNRACIRLLKHLGFKMDTVLKNYEIINGKLTDCFLATKMREA